MIVDGDVCWVAWCDCAEGAHTHLSQCKNNNTCATKDTESISQLKLKNKHKCSKKVIGCLTAGGRTRGVGLGYMELVTNKASHITASPAVMCRAISLNHTAQASSESIGKGGCWKYNASSGCTDVVSIATGSEMVQQYRSRMVQVLCALCRTSTDVPLLVHAATTLLHLATGHGAARLILDEGILQYTFFHADNTRRTSSCKEFGSSG